MPSTNSPTTNTEIVVTIVFGITATAIGGLTVWQAHRSWKLWKEHRSRLDQLSEDLELRIVSTGNPFDTPPTSRTDHGSLDLTTVGTETVPTDPLDGSGIGAE
ncbi:MAG: hypothetical protein Q9164_007139 [Protoblastenia rupestris]